MTTFLGAACGFAVATLVLFGIARLWMFIDMRRQRPLIRRIAWFGDHMLRPPIEEGSFRNRVEGARAAGVGCTLQRGRTLQYYSGFVEGLADYASMLRTANVISWPVIDAIQAGELFKLRDRLVKEYLQVHPEILQPADIPLEHQRLLTRAAALISSPVYDRIDKTFSELGIFWKVVPFLEHIRRLTLSAGPTMERHYRGIRIKKDTQALKA